MVKAGGIRRRRKAAITLSALAALAVYGGIRVALFVTGRPVISVNYAIEYNERLRPANLAPSDNAAPLYQEALARLPAMPDDVRGIRQLREYEPGGIEWRAVEFWLAASDEALQLIQQAAGKPGFWWKLSAINYDDPAFMEDTGFSRLREAMPALRRQAQYLAVKGEMRGAFECILTMCRMACHLKTAGGFQSNLGHAMEGLAYATAFDLLCEPDVDANPLGEFQRQLGQTLAPEPPSFEGDRIVLCDAIQRYFTDDGRGDGHLIPRAVYAYRRRTRTPANELAANAAYLSSLHAAWVHPSRQETIATLTRLVASANELVRQAPWELHSKGMDPAGQLAGLAAGNHFLRMMMVDETLAWRIETHHRIRVLGEALIATTATLRFHEDEGVWPRSLEELAAAGYVRQVPIDPYSGKPLVYRQTDGSFILYSLGQDFDDDGGTPGQWGRSPGGGDLVFWPLEGRTK